MEFSFFHFFISNILFLEEKPLLRITWEPETPKYSASFLIIALFALPCLADSLTKTINYFSFFASLLIFLN